MLAADEARIKQVIVPNPEAGILAEGVPAPPEALAQAREQFSHSVRRLKPGETVRLGGGRELVIDETDIGPERQLLALSDGPLPFLLVKYEGSWNVDAKPVIAARKVAAKERKAPGGKPDTAAGHGP